jgi:hypothetical protein
MGISNVLIFASCIVPSTSVNMCLKDQIDRYLIIKYLENFPSVFGGLGFSMTIHGYPSIEKRRDLMPNP